MSYSDPPCCPKCGSAMSVNFLHREGSTGPSNDVWHCGHCDIQFTTTAR